MSEKKLFLEKKTNLNDWNDEKMNSLKSKDFSMICFASRRSGKSELIKYIYNKLDLQSEYDYCMIISESDESLDFYSDFLFGNLFIKKFDNDVITNLIVESQKLETEGKKARFLCIIDDVVGSTIKYSESIAKLYAIGRHYHISCILICQQLTLINVTVRNNSDIIFIGQTKTSKEKKSIIDNFLDGIADDNEILDKGFETKKSFYNEMIKYNTEDYSFIVFDYLNGKKNNFDSVVHKIKAKIQIQNHNK
jgi:hypothetical protein